MVFIKIILLNYKKDNFNNYRTLFMNRETNVQPGFIAGDVYAVTARLVVLASLQIFRGKHQQLCVIATKIRITKL